MKKRLILSIMALGFVAFVANEADAQRRWQRYGRPGKAGEFTISASIGQAMLYDTLYDVGVARGPLTGEFVVQYALNRYVTLDFGFILGYDSARKYEADPTKNVASAALIAGRPGVHLYLPLWWHWRPYARFALPLSWRSQADPEQFYVQFMAGVGIEYRWQHVGLFFEVNFAPFVKSDFLMPIDYRFGVAAHF